MRRGIGFEQPVARRTRWRRTSRRRRRLRGDAPGQQHAGGSCSRHEEMEAAATTSAYSRGQGRCCCRSVGNGQVVGGGHPAAGWHAAATAVQEPLMTPRGMHQPVTGGIAGGSGHHPGCCPAALSRTPLVSNAAAAAAAVVAYSGFRRLCRHRQQRWPPSMENNDKDAVSRGDWDLNKCDTTWSHVWPIARHLPVHNPASS